ncbi:MAG: hypothetical protein ACR2K1_15495, partial [Saprospiraceae bacterium]
MANKKISELEAGQQVVADTQIPGSLGAQTFKYTAQQIADYVRSLVASGDVDGALTAVSVVGIRNRSVLNTAPTSGQALRWNGTAWEPINDPSLTLGGDLTGNTSDAVVVKIQGRSVLNTAPTSGQILKYNGT